MLSRRLLRIKVVKALYAHFKSEPGSFAVSEKNLVATVDKAYDLYLQMLWLPVEVLRYAEKRIDIARSKKLPSHEDLHPNTKFVDNALIRRIEGSERLARLLERKGLGWVQYPELIKTLYAEMLESDYYREYMASPERSWKDDAKLLEDFYVNTAEDNEALEQVLEEQSILWSDDTDFALILAVRTAATSKASADDIAILPQYKNDDDKAFLSELFNAAVSRYDEFMACIEELTRNWDVERIAFMDSMIMVAALAELATFDSIPVKVTLDEYIEIAKYYSTPGSAHFINGVLDKAVASLTEKGLITKFGRGLL